MGDMADYLNEQIECPDDWGYEHEDVDLDCYEPKKPAKTIACRCCGESGLRWEKADSKWRLYNDKNLHKCLVNPLKS